jgi:hypothetical protein
MKLPEGSKGKYALRVDRKARKTRFTFPENAETTRGKCEFKSPEELLSYLEKPFSTRFLSSGRRAHPLQGIEEEKLGALVDGRRG